MQIDINTGAGISRSASLDAHVEQKLERVNRRYGDRVLRVIVHLKDVNAAKGGVDKECAMEARPAGLEPVAVRTRDEDTFQAVAEAADKLERALARRLGRAADAG